MVGVIFVYTDTVFGFYGYSFFLCLVGRFSMITWTPAVLIIFFACVLYFCICTCSAQLSMFHMERLSRHTLIIIIIIIIIILFFSSRSNVILIIQYCQTHTYTNKHRQTFTVVHTHTLTHEVDQRLIVQGLSHIFFKTSLGSLV